MDESEEAVTGLATEEELYRFLSDVMRGFVTEPGGKDVSVGDRLKACGSLMKLFETRQTQTAAGDR